MILSYIVMLQNVENYIRCVIGISTYMDFRPRHERKMQTKEWVSSYVSKFILHIEFSLIIIWYHSVDVMSDIILEWNHKFHIELILYIMVYIFENHQIHYLII